MIEWQLIDQLLQTVPRGQDGMLPYDQFKKMPQWAKLIEGRPEASVRTACFRRWQKSLIEVKVPEPTPTKVQQLNHAYNFCPSCGFKLN